MMKQVKMSKTALQAVVKKNREEHRELFEEAHEAFREKAIGNLESRIQQIKSGKPVELYLNLVVPEDHTDDYDRVIAMLDYELDDEVTLSAGEFAQYVQDDWGWKANFSQSYTVNTGKVL